MTINGRELEGVAKIKVIGIGGGGPTRFLVCFENVFQGWITLL